MLDKFCDYFNSKVGKSIYLWGGQGEKGNQITEALIKKKENSTANYNRVIKFWTELKKKIDPIIIEAYDCSGMAVCWLLENKLIKSDMTANGLMKMCEKIARKNLQKGDWVFKVNKDGHAFHIGYVVDDALNVVEAKGRDYGVIKSHVSSTNWNAFGRPPFFLDDLKADDVPTLIRSAICIGDGVNIRKSANGTAIGQVNKNHPIIVSGSGDWLRCVTLKDNKALDGYIFAEYVKYANEKV